MRCRLAPRWCRLGHRRCRLGAGSVPDGHGAGSVPARSPPVPTPCLLGHRGCLLGHRRCRSMAARFPPVTVPARWRLGHRRLGVGLVSARCRLGSRRSRCRLDAGSVPTAGPPVPARSSQVPARCRLGPRCRLGHGHRCRFDGCSVPAGHCAGSMPARSLPVPAQSPPVPDRCRLGYRRGRLGHRWCRLGAGSVLSWFPPLGSHRCRLGSQPPTGAGSVPVLFLFTQIIDSQRINQH